jgi:hypothetical protein
MYILVDLSENEEAFNHPILKNRLDELKRMQSNIQYTSKDQELKP